MSDRAAGSGLGVAGIQVLGEIGRGSFGRVFEAIEPENGRRVAVKVLQNAALDETTLKRFDRERRAAGALSSHPNIVTVHRSGLDDAGHPYLVMELATSRSMSDRLRAGPLPAAEVADVGVKLAGAVETAHRVDVVHCDIKPENVLVSASNEPLLADFGIARVARAGSSSLGRAGTFAYSAPEIFRGEPPSPASDVFALGATLYALATGASPFMPDPTSSQESVMFRIMSDDPPDARAAGVPDPLAAVIERALDKAPERRYGSAAELGEALRHAQATMGEPPTRLVVQEIVLPDAAEGAAVADPGTVALLPRASSSQPLPGPAKRAGGRGRLGLLAGAAALVVAVVAGALVAMRGGDEGTEEVAVLGARAAVGSSSTSAPAATTSSAVALQPLTHQSAPVGFLGTRVERRWNVPEQQDELVVELTFTNTSAQPFRWHHDEVVPASLAGSASALQASPAGEPLTVGGNPGLRWWHELAPGQQQKVSYEVARQPGWPKVLATSDLQQWDAAQGPLLEARRAEIAVSNGVPANAPVPPTATTVPPSTSAPAAPAAGPSGPSGPPAPTQPSPGAPVVVQSPSAPAVPAPTVRIVGPDVINAGEQASWSVEAANAVRGTWTESCVGASRPNWQPGDGFGGVWNNPGNCSLSLTVYNSAGQAATATKDFTVQAAAPYAELSGPSSFGVGQYAEFVPRYSANVVNGTWHDTCQTPNNPNWAPGGYYAGTWGRPGACTLSLTVYNSYGQSYTASINFTVR